MLDNGKKVDPERMWKHYDINFPINILKFYYDIGFTP